MEAAAGCERRTRPGVTRDPASPGAAPAQARGAGSDEEKQGFRTYLESQRNYCMLAINIYLKLKKKT